MQAIHLISGEILREVFSLGLKKSRIPDQRLDFVIRQSKLTLAVLHEMDIRGMNWMDQFDEYQRLIANDEIPKKSAERRKFIPTVSPLAVELFLTQENEKTYHLLRNVVPSDHNVQLTHDNDAQLSIATASYNNSSKRSIQPDTTHDANKKIAKLDVVRNTDPTNELLDRLEPEKPLPKQSNTLINKDEDMALKN